MGKKRKFYVVWKGRKTGDFMNWEDCSAQVNGFTGAEYKSFDTLAAAREALRGGYEKYAGKHVPHLSQERLIEIGSPVLPSYCVDAACSGNTGTLEYRCVHTETREELFSQGPYDSGTNNVGEFLAIVHALARFNKNGISLPIYSDSEVALGWVKGKRCKTNLSKNENNTELFELIARAEQWLADNTYANKVLKWETEAWGQIPADYGRK